MYIATPPGAHAGLTLSRSSRQARLCEKPSSRTARDPLDGGGLPQKRRAAHDRLSKVVRTQHTSSKTPRFSAATSVASIPFTPPSANALFRAPPYLGWSTPRSPAAARSWISAYIASIPPAGSLRRIPTRSRRKSWIHDQSRFREVEEGISFQLKFSSGLLLQGSSTYSSAPSSFIFIQGSKGWALADSGLPFRSGAPFSVEKSTDGQIPKNLKIVDEFAPEIDASLPPFSRKRKWLRTASRAIAI